MLPAAQTKDKNDISPEQVKDIVVELKQDFDYVIIDCPAGIEQGFRNAIAGAIAAIVVTTPENAAVRDADRVIGLLEQTQVPSPKLVINRIRAEYGEAAAICSTSMKFARCSRSTCSASCRMTRTSSDAANAGEPTVMNPSSRAAIAYRNIARRMLGRDGAAHAAGREDRAYSASDSASFLGIG